MTLQEALELFLAAKPRSDATKRLYQHTLGMHFRFLGGPERCAASVTPDEIKDWVEDLADQGLSFWTVNGRVKDVKAFWKWLADEGHIPSTPAASHKVSKFKPNRMRKMAITDENLARLLECARQKGAREYAIVRMLADTGCRRAAVVNLRLNQLDLEGHEATLIGKGDKPYDVALSQKLVDALRVWLRERPDDPDHGYVFVCTNEPYDPLSPSGLSSLWRRLVEDAGIENGRANMHSLRHWFTSKLARMGTNMAYIQEALGHQDMETTRLYVRVCMEQMKEIVERGSAQA